MSLEHSTNLLKQDLCAFFSEKAWKRLWKWSCVVATLFLFVRFYFFAQFNFGSVTSKNEKKTEQTIDQLMNQNVAECIKSKEVFLSYFPMILKSRVASAVFFSSLWEIYKRKCEQNYSVPRAKNDPKTQWPREKSERKLESKISRELDGFKACAGTGNKPSRSWNTFSLSVMQKSEVYERIKQQ